MDGGTVGWRVGCGVGLASVYDGTVVGVHEGVDVGVRDGGEVGSPC